MQNTQARTGDLTPNQIAWCDKWLKPFELMRKQAELAASQLDQRPAIPKIELAN